MGSETPTVASHCCTARRCCGFLDLQHELENLHNCVPLNSDISLTRVLLDRCAETHCSAKSLLVYAGKGKWFSTGRREQHTDDTTGSFRTKINMPVSVCYSGLFLCFQHIIRNAREMEG